MNTHSILTAVNGAFGRISGYHTNHQQTSEYQKTKHQQRHGRTAGHHQPAIDEQRCDRPIRQEQQQRGNHTEIRIPVPLIERVIPIHWAYAIGKQPLPGGHIIRIRRVTQRIRHIQIQPRVTIKQRPCHVIVLVEIIRVRAFRMEAQRSRLHQLPHHNGTSDHNRHRQQRPQPRTLPHTRCIQRHPPQPRTRPPHQYHRQHGHHHADTQRIQRERYTHIRTHRIKRNQRTLRLDNRTHTEPPAAAACTYSERGEDTDTELTVPALRLTSGRTRTVRNTCSDCLAALSNAFEDTGSIRTYSDEPSASTCIYACVGSVTFNNPSSVRSSPGPSMLYAAAESPDAVKERQNGILHNTHSTATITAKATTMAAHIRRRA